MHGATPDESADTSLRRLLGRESSPTVPAPGPVNIASAVDALVRGIVGPDIAPSGRPERAQIAGVIDLQIAERMRAVLQDPSFQALASAWRTVHFLVGRLDLDQDLELRLLDVIRTELSTAAAEPDLERSALWKAVVGGARDGDDEAGWSMVVALESFDASKEDIALLAGQAFRDSGWDLDIDGHLEIEDLRAWVYRDGDERRHYPCAKTWLGERGGQAVLARGPMALLSRRGRPAHALAVHSRAGHCPRRALVAVARASPWHDSRPP
jgi:hypothetical protein